MMTSEDEALEAIGQAFKNFAKWLQTTFASFRNVKGNGLKVLFVTDLSSGGSYCTEVTPGIER
ncbi:MAG: hypothetical protein CMJ80_13480 [Planctomycetaceae bacterium]|nr:hypothetical protein [Planctomycetaceae bacterium]